MASPSATIVLEPLNDRNYVDWSDLVQTYLLAHDLWDVAAAEPSSDAGEAKLKAWTRTNAAALHSIKLSCGPEARSIIRGVGSAREAWLKLARLEPQPSRDSEPPPEANTAQPGIDFHRGDDNEPFFQAALRGDWKTAKRFYDRDPEVLEKRVPNSGNLTALHLAVANKNAAAVEDMVRVMRKEALEIKDCNGSTPLAVATVTGITRVAKCMVEKNVKITSVANDRGSIPVVMALSYGSMPMARYLYSVTPLQVLLPGSGTHGATLITKSIEMEILDIALHLLRRCPDLAVAKDRYGKTPIYVLSCAISLFSCGRQLRFWQRWMYNGVHAEPIHDTYNIFIHDQDPENTQSNRNITISSVLDVLRRFPSYLLELSGIKGIFETKLTHNRCIELLDVMGEKIKTIDERHMRQGLVYDAMFSAVDRGNVKFIVGLTKAKPELWKSTDAMSRDIFMRAIQSRQAEIFSLIHITGDETKALAGVKVDKFNNNMLHIAGFLAPFSQLNRISGATLQMQRELQWFKMVETVVPHAALTFENVDSLTPRDLFSKNHKDLVIAGETWMKTTASSSTVVGALIITMTFAATFTVPGGNNQETGIPIFTDRMLFKVFMVANAMSLVCSTTSVLMFLGILTSRYAEDDFLVSLPGKLVIGLSTLFFSIASTMVAFCSALLIILELKTWDVIVPVTVLSSIPIVFFALMHFPLLVEILFSTYGPSIFSKKVMIKYLS